MLFKVLSDIRAAPKKCRESLQLSVSTAPLLKG